MKKLLFAICGSSLLWAGCKEHDTPIDFGTTASTDTTYVISPVPAPTKRQVLVEEFTGQACPNCPQAHSNLDAISSGNLGLVNVVSMYTYGNPQSIPPSGAIYNFQDSIATNIANIVYGSISGLPTAGIDRFPIGGSIQQQGDQTWDAIIDTELTKPDSINLTVTSSYDATTKQATIITAVTYLYAFSTPQNLSIYIVEDSITDLQTFSNGGDQSYLFLDVFRDMVTSQPFGDLLQATTGNNAKVAGQFFQHVYGPYTLPVTSPAIKPANCRVIAFVNCTNGTDIHVMQSAQCKFAP